jgi:nudix-type nucleoside diphosphatase (YffH/AdpP family)
LSALFLHPPFNDPALLARILDPVPPLSPAALPDHALAGDAYGLRVAPVPAPGNRIEGHLATPGPEARARLDFVFAALGAAPAPAAPLADGEAVAAEAYGFLPGTAPDGRWQPALADRQRAHVGETLEEIIGHFGRRPAAAMPALLHGITVRAIGRARAPLQRVPRALGSALGSADVEPVERDFAYAHFFGLEEHRLRHRRFDGAFSDVLQRGVFTSGDAVTVLPFDPGRSAVLLIEQFRAGPFARRDPRPWCLEAIAGRCDSDEPPEATARREAAEEAGLDLGRLERITGYYTTPGIASEYITAFIGEADLAGAGGGTHGLAEEHEDIRTLVVPLADALAAAASGEINNAPLLLSLYWLDRHADRLRADWR